MNAHASSLARARRVHPLAKVALAVLSVLCAAPSDCGGGGGGGNATSTYVIPDQTTQNLASGDVDTIVRQAINEATARHRPATIAVVDRLGNVLAVTQMAGAPTGVSITSNTGVATGLEDPTKVPPGAVPATMAAVAKAVTGAFLSSGGNAFTTRTASQIVQQHFNPGVLGSPGGPLFGVQFSQLPCSDFNRFFGDAPHVPGPQRSPLGLAADPGGMPIYKQGVMVGGIGIVSKTTYTLDLNVFDFDQDTSAGDDDEIIAIAGVSGFTAPFPIQAENISVGNTTLRYTDAGNGDLAAPVARSVAPYTLVSVPGLYVAPAPATAPPAAPGTGATWGTLAAGVFPDGTSGDGVQYPGVDAWTFFNAATPGHERVPRAGFAPAGGQAITAEEARQLVISGLTIAFEARGQIRIPTNSNAEVSVAIVDLDGNLLAMARTPDAPVFGADVSVQKARSVVFFSRAPADPANAFHEIGSITAPPVLPSSPTASFTYYTSASSLAAPSLFDSGTAFSDRALGDLARPFYPDGIDGNPNGPLSLPIGSWSVFSDGLQLDLIIADIATYGLGAAANPTPPAAGCGNGSGGNTLGGGANTGLVPSAAPEDQRTPLANGLQIFPGGEPIYRNGTLVGAIGVSGDGVEQDDMVSYLGLQNYAAVANGLSPLTNAPSGIRADTISLGSPPAPLSYIICPDAPFLNSRVQNAC